MAGRGGAAFPAATKWEAVAQHPARPHYVVVNADESETGTFKDRILLEWDPYAVLEGDVELSDVAATPDDATVEELVDLYRSLQGEHEDWDDYRAAMVAERRVVVRIRPNHAYGALP